MSPIVRPAKGLGVGFHGRVLPLDCTTHTCLLHRPGYNSMYSIEITSDIDSWLAQPDVWNSLSRGVPFRETSWLAAWWKHLGHDLTGYLVIARDSNGRVCGLLPLYRDGGTTRGRTLRSLGDGNACTDDVSVLALDEHAIPVAEAIGRFLASQSTHAEHGWDLIDLDGILEGDMASGALARGLRLGGATLHSHSRMNTWLKSTDGSWESQLTKMSKSNRRALVQSIKKFDSTEHVDFVPTTDADVSLNLCRLIELHQARWIAAGEPGTYAEPEFRHFIEDAVESFRQRGLLFFPTLTFHDQMIAGELHFVGTNRISYCYSTGYNIVHADLEPGRMLNAQVLKSAHDQGFHGVELLRGDETYKQRLGATPRKLLRVRVVAPSFVPRLCHAAWKTQFELKQWMRRRAGRKLIDVVNMEVAT